MTVIEHQRESLLADARSWLNTPFHQGARVKGAGVDCGTLLAEVYSRAGFGPIDWSEPFAVDWFLHETTERYLALLDHFCRRVETPLPGDVAIFKYGRAYSHATIVVSWPSQAIQAHWRNGVEYTDCSKEPLCGRPVIFFSPWPA